jgi:O-antigen/teichoic acid export membrane protein
VIRQIGLTLGTRIGLTAFGLATSIVTARFLGQTGRGEYFFMVTLAATVVQFANIGLPSSNTFLAARDPRLQPALLGNSLWVSLGVAGGAGTAVALIAHGAGMLQDTPTSYLWLAAALAPPSLFYLLAANLLVGTGRIRAFNAAEAGSRALVLGALVTAGAAGAGAAGFVAASVVAWAVAATATGWLVVRRSSLALRPRADVLASGFRYATKAYLVTLLAFLILRANVFLLRREHGPADLGLYSVAAQIADVLLILPQAVALVLFPRLVRDSAGRWESTRTSTVIVGVAMLVVCAVAAAVAEPVIRFLYGEQFVLSARVLQIMLPGVLCLAVTNVLAQYLGAVGIPRPLLAVWAGGAVLVAALSLTLIPGHAGAGAAASLSATYAVVMLGVAATVVWYHRRHPRDEADGLPLQAQSTELPPSAE